MARLTGVVRAAADRRFHALAVGVATAVCVVLAATTSLGFATFAVYTYLDALEGPRVAALILSAFYGVVALAIWLTSKLRRKSSGLRVEASAATPSPSDNGAALLRQVLAAAGATREQIALVASAQIGRELSTLQLLTVALIGGFVAGCKLRK